MNTAQKLIDETGNQYGYLTVLEKGKTKNNRTGWKCRCNLCGNIKVIRGSDLRTKKSVSCGCLKSVGIVEEPGTIYGFLEVIEKDPAPAKEFKDNCIHWKCKCLKCGTICSISGKNLRNGDTISCGCIKSFGEECISKFLNQNNIKFIKEYKYLELLGEKLPLRFDFAILNENNFIKYLIEYNGNQHYTTMGQFEKNNNTLEKRQERDNKKIEFCLNNKIPLYIISNKFNFEDKEKTQRNIELILNCIIKNFKENKNYVPISNFDISYVSC